MERAALKYDFYFLNFSGTKLLFSIFERNQIEALFVGGCVRDAILGEKTEDFDIAINAGISDVINILKNEGIECILTGIKYSSITVIINGLKFQLTSLRKDEKCFGRHCEHSRTSSLKEDVKRRDFTINAIYVSKSGELFDYFNGIKDLYNKKVRFIGDLEKRITEDYLRIFRYYRFCAKYGDLENQYSDAIKNFSKQIKLISIERIQKELFKVLESKHTIPILSNMNNSLVFSNIFNNVNIDTLTKAPQDISLDLKLYLSFSYDDLTTTFRLTKLQKQKIKEYKHYEKERALFCYYKKGKEFLEEIEIIKRSVLNEQIDLSITNKKLPEFPIKYKDLPIEIKNAAMKIKACEKWWVNNNFKPNKNNCLSYIKSINSLG
ncbi:MAG: hypothetical protein LBU35_02565 [Holosporales bacterium]|jgi:poly(A) polymerase|nr:hypothetical protein [Holosporales bacterium]